ncbi:MAG: hypothetical protein IBX72_15325 [Nitrospirae bacterium]|nr:hypothetical protein [Nitrospirota bacterium]
MKGLLAWKLQKNCLLISKEMYAIAIIVLFGLLATLMPFAVIPLPELPVREMQTPVFNVPNDNFKKDNVEQYIVSLCSQRKVEGKTDTFPQCSGECMVDLLSYSDETIDLASLIGSENIRKSDGNIFKFKTITAKTCDASEFIY